MYYLSFIIIISVLFFGTRVFFNKPFLKYKKILYLNLAIFFIFALFTYFVKAGFFNEINAATIDIIANIQNIKVMNFMFYVSAIFSPEWVAIASVAFVLIFAYFKKNSLAMFFLIFTIGAASSQYFLKEFVGISRPVKSFVIEKGLSFPSGHTTMAFVIFLFFSLLINQLRIKNSFKFFLIAFFVFLMFLISFSRLYLGVHYFSDILGGIILGLFWLTFSFMIVNPFSKEEGRPARLC